MIKIVLIEKQQTCGLHASTNIDMGRSGLAVARTITFYAIEACIIRTNGSPCSHARLTTLSFV